MPVTAKLSQQFYERLGDEVTNELVAWLNDVDSSFRHELKELNDATWARIEARLEALEARTDAKLDRLGTELRGEFRSGMAELKSELLRWMFLFWVGTMGTVLAILKL